MKKTEIQKRIKIYKYSLKIAEIKKQNRLVDAIKSDIKILESMYQTKFIFILSPELKKYIDWKSDRNRTHKAHIVRNAILRKIKKDKEYLTSLSNI